MKEEIKRLILKYKDVASALWIESVETEYSDDAEKCYVEINTLENVMHDLKQLLKDCSIPVVISRLNFKQIESLVQLVHFADSDYGNNKKQCAELIEKTRNKIGYTKEDVKAYL